MLENGATKIYLWWVYSKNECDKYQKPDNLLKMISRFLKNLP